MGQDLLLPKVIGLFLFSLFMVKWVFFDFNLVLDLGVTFSAFAYFSSQILEFWV